MYQLKLDKLTDGQTCYWFWETQRSSGPKLADIISSNYKKSFISKQNITDSGQLGDN